MLSYWSDRMLNPEFRAGMDARLDVVLAQASPAPRQPLESLRAEIQRRFDVFNQADDDAETVRARDFSVEEKLDLLMRNDREGKREALQAGLARLFDAVGGFATPGNPFVTLVLSDLQAQAERHAAQRREYMDLSRSVRVGAWQAVPSAYDAQKHERLEALRGGPDGLEDGRRSCWELPDRLRVAHEFCS